VLYGATNGENWRRQNGWMSEAPLGEWEGVTVDAAGRVTHLTLSDNNLTGRVTAITSITGQK